MKEFILHRKDIPGGKAILFMKTDGTASARLYWYDDDESTVYLDSLSVDAECRHQHLGTKLQEVRELLGAQLGAKQAMLFVDKGSWMHDWYVRRGYRDYMTHDYPNYMWMVKDISVPKKSERVSAEELLRSKMRQVTAILSEPIPGAELILVYACVDEDGQECLFLRSPIRNMEKGEWDLDYSTLTGSIDPALLIYRLKRGTIEDVLGITRIWEESPINIHDRNLNICKELLTVSYLNS